MKNYLFAVLLVTVFLAGCSTEGELNVIDPITQPNIPSEETSSSWLDSPLIEVFSGDQVRVGLYEEEFPLYVQAATTQCTSCLEQQELFERASTSYLVTYTEPSESVFEIRRYVEEQGLRSGLHALSDEVYRSLLAEEFGLSAAELREGAVILVCSSQQAVLVDEALAQVNDVQRVKNNNC